MTKAATLTGLMLAAVATAHVHAAWADAGTQTVAILRGQFSPATLTVRAGETVVWVNNDDSDHTVVAGDGTFASGVLKRGEQFAHQFAAAGNFAYADRLHPRMRATVVAR